MYAPEDVKVDDIPGGLIVYRSDSEEILYANSVALRMFECDNLSDFMLFSGGRFSSLVLKDDVYLAAHSLRTNVVLEELCSGHVYYRCKTKNGRVIFVEEFGREVDDKEKGSLNYLILIPHNNKGQGMIDPLTGLISTYLLLEVAESKRQQCLKAHREFKLTVIYFNLVKFRLYNETFGTAAGNEFIRKTGGLLRRVFNTDSISRMSGDRFVVLYSQHDEEEKIKEVHEKVATLDPSYSMRITAGIFYSDSNQTVIEACDFAKAACEEIVDGDEVYYRVETAERRFALDLKKYVQASLENALSKKYIKVYYQPVVRTLSGAVCSVEALSRWEDPRHGYISPAIYIAALEESGLSIKLDSYVVREVAAMLHQRIVSGQQVLPVSVNFSRKDFIFGDPFAAVETVVDHYDLPRELICIEITESAVMDDPKLIRQQMQNFKNAGYELWMDDFGSAYSSLNILKDFPFDEIKIDLGFLRNFNENGRKIITSVVDMAKKLGMHTLAEGVENSVQLDFLRSIGCEKIQGYYLGKPMLLEEFFEYSAANSVHLETPVERELYNAAGTVNFVTDLPLAMFLYDGKKLRPLILNGEYKKIIATAGFSTETAFAEVINSTLYPVSRKLNKLTLDAVKSGREESRDIVLNDRYFRFYAKIVSQSTAGTMVQGSIADLTYDMAHRRVLELDEVLRNIVSAYDCIYLIDGDEESFEVIETDRPNEKAGDKIYNFFTSQALATVFKLIYFADRDKFRKYASVSFIHETISRIGRGYFTEVFRVKQVDGNFEWKAFTVIALPDTGRRRYLLCVRPSSLANMQNPLELAFSLMGNDSTQIPLNSLSKSEVGQTWDHGDNLWNAFANLGNIKFFWKDTDRRFVGASRSFLDYYGFKSFDEIAGKTDEEIGWHLDNDPFREDELAVLQQGRVIVNSQGQNVINGNIRNIVATKFPVYKNGKICGLSGYFIDTDEISLSSELATASFVDKTTGFMNSRGFIVATAQFEDNFRMHTEDYVLSVIHISSYHNILALHGKETAEALILKIADIIRSHFGIGSTFARIQHNRFVICSKFTDSERNLIRAVEQCVAEIGKIREINGRHFTVSVSHGEALGSEAHSIVQLFELVLSRMAGMGGRNWFLTPYEMHERVVSLKKIFDMVRLVDVSRRKVIRFEENGSRAENAGFCCRVWGRERRCTNCISAKVLQSKAMDSKFEVIDGSIFYVIARYTEVDGKPYVLELINRLVEPPFPQSQQREQLTSRLIRFNSDAYTDHLTGVLNRRYFNEQLVNLTVKAVAVIDIDDLKNNNEKYGHAWGDEILRRMARSIVETVGDRGSVLRYGGDEFVVCFEVIEQEELKDLLYSIREKIKTLSSERGEEIKVSIGACYGSDRVDELLSNADRCLFESKISHGIKILLRKDQKTVF